MQPDMVSVVPLAYVFPKLPILFIIDEMTTITPVYAHTHCVYK